MTSNGSSGGKPFSVVIEGAVEASNAKGIKVNGEWINVSVFKPVELPDVGTLVTLGLDPKGFITTLEVMDDFDNLSKSQVVTSKSRDRTISRLAVLKAAANFAATRTDIKSGDVLRIADLWLAWIEA